MKNLVIALLSLFAFCFVISAETQASGPEKQEVSKTVSNAQSFYFVAEVNPIIPFILPDLRATVLMPQYTFTEGVKKRTNPTYFRAPRDGLSCSSDTFI